MTWFEDQPAERQKTLTKALKSPRAEHVLHYTKGLPGFSEWMLVVDATIHRTVPPLTFLDLGDQTWRDWYEDEVPPEQAADEAVNTEFEMFGGLG